MEQGRISARQKMQRSARKADRAISEVRRKEDLQGPKNFYQTIEKVKAKS